MVENEAGGYHGLLPVDRLLVEWAAEVKTAAKQTPGPVALLNQRSLRPVAAAVAVG